MAVGETISIPIHVNTKKYREWYKMVRDFLEGDVANQTYVRPYNTDFNEDGTLHPDYGRRVNASYNLNITEPVLIQHSSALSQPVSVRGFENQPELLEDVTGFGCDHQSFYQHQIHEHLALGTHIVLVESPNVAVTNRQQAQALGLRPFLVLFQAENCRFWSHYEEGPRKGWLKELIVENDLVVVDGKKHRSFRRYYYPADAQMYSVQDLRSSRAIGAIEIDTTLNDTEKYDVVEELESGRERIPAVVFGGSTEFSELRTTVSLNFALLNKLSALTNTNYNQSFQRSIIFGGNDLEGMRNVGQGLFGHVPDPSAKLETIPPGDPSSLFQEVSMILVWNRRISMYQISQLTDDSTKQIQSAESRAKDLLVLEHVYNNIATHAERQLTELYRIYKSFADSSLSVESIQEQVSVSIGRDFNLADTELELARDSLVMSWAREFGQPGEQIRKQILKRYVGEMRFVAGDDGEEEKVRQELLQALDSAVSTADSPTVRRLQDRFVNGRGAFELGQALNADGA